MQHKLYRTNRSFDKKIIKRQYQIKIEVLLHIYNPKIVQICPCRNWNYSILPFCLGQVIFLLLTSCFVFVLIVNMASMHMSQTPRIQILGEKRSKFYHQQLNMVLNYS